MPAFRRGRGQDPGHPERDARTWPVSRSRRTCGGSTSRRALMVRRPSSCSTGSIIQLNKKGTFGWTKLTYVGEINEKKQAGPSFGLFATGYLWIDDVTLERVGPEVALTAAPELAGEESPIAPPGKLSAEAVRCSQCGYRNNAAWKTCYACGTALAAKKAGGSGPNVKSIASFESGNPFSGGDVVAVHASEGRKALRLERAMRAWSSRRTGWVTTSSRPTCSPRRASPSNLYVEIRDTATRRTTGPGSITPRSCRRGRAP